MSTDLGAEDTQALIGYARQKFAEERYPLAPALRPVREVLAKLDPKPEPVPLPPAKPYEPSLVAQRRKKLR
jgi:hypothetical protein